MLLVAVSDVPRRQLELPGQLLSPIVASLDLHQRSQRGVLNPSNFMRAAAPFLACTASGNGAGETPGSLKASTLVWYSRHVRPTAFLDDWALADSLSRSFAFSIPVTSIIPTVRAASLLCDPITTPQRNGAGSGSTHCSVLSKSRDAQGKALPDFHSMLSWIFSHGPVPGNQEQHFACATGTSGEPSRTEKKPAQKCARSIRHVLSLQPECSCAQRSKWNHLRVTKTKLQHVASIQTKPPQTASRHENCTRTEDASGVEWS